MTVQTTTDMADVAGSAVSSTIAEQRGHRRLRTGSSRDLRCHRHPGRGDRSFPGCAGPRAAHRPGVRVKYSGTLKKINDSGVIASAIARTRRRSRSSMRSESRSAIRSTCAKSSSRRSPRSSEGHPRRVSAGDAGESLRSRQLRRVDLECGSTTNNAERRKIDAFSPTMFVTGTKLLVRRGSGILNFRDLRGKTIVLTRGTVHETGVPRLAQRQKLADQVRVRRRSQRVVPDARRAARRMRSPTTTSSSTACSRKRDRQRISRRRRLPHLRRLRAHVSQGRSRVRRGRRARVPSARRQPRNRGDLRALVPEAAAVRRAAQLADESASGGAVPRPGSASD